MHLGQRGGLTFAITQKAIETLRLATVATLVQRKHKLQETAQ